MFERILSGSRYLTLLTVVGSLLCSVFVYGLSLIELYSVVQGLIVRDMDAKTVVIEFFHVVDYFLIAMAFNIVAVGIYRIFVSNDFPVPPAMEMSGLTELKQTLVKVLTIVLAIMFVEEAEKLGPSQFLLGYGLATAAVILALSLALFLDARAEHPGTRH